ncbi:MAG: ABC transporter ATP-binding protein [Acidimicrobiia bacterium]
MTDTFSEPVTIYDLQGREDAKIDIKRMPDLVRRASRLVLTAGKREFVISTALQIVSATAIGIQLIVGRGALAQLLEADRSGAGLGTVAPWALGLAALTALSLFASVIQREQQQILGELVSRYMHGRALAIAAKVELAAFEHPDFHNRLQRVQSGSQQPLNMVYGVSGLISALMGVIGVSVALIAIEPLLIPLVLTVLLPAWLAASRRSSAFWHFFWRMTPSDRERNYVGKLLSGRDEAKEVRAFGLGHLLLDRWNRLFDHRLRELRSVARKQLFFTLLSTAVIGALLGGIILLIAFLASSGRVSLAEAGVAVAGIAGVGARLAGAGWSVSTLSEAGFYLDDYNVFLSLGGETRPVTHPTPNGFDRITTTAVTFTYPSASEPALIEASVHIDRGEVVALVGENGSGKSTMAKLLAGLYRPDSGTVAWDGVDIASLDPTDFSRQVAIIFQDFLRYHLSASDNIGLGRYEAAEDRQAISDAASQAGADGFIEKLPKGYETLLGPEFLGGVDLSVGQWQRMALARAFFRNAPLVILDEPTAALDARAEHELFEKIRSLLEDRTVLLISHRFSSVRTADRIYVLHQGRVVEDGTHDDLLAANGRYAEMFNLQAAAYLA